MWRFVAVVAVIASYGRQIVSQQLVKSTSDAAVFKITNKRSVQVVGTNAEKGVIDISPGSENEIIGIERLIVICESNIFEHQNTIQIIQISTIEFADTVEG